MWWGKRREKGRRKSQDIPEVLDRPEHRDRRVRKLKKYSNENV